MRVKLPQSQDERLNKIDQKIRGKSILALPKLHEPILEWIRLDRPLIGHRKRDFKLEPFWPPVYLDNHPSKVLVNGRQTFKTTYCSDKVAHGATTNTGVEVCYVVDNEPHLSAFSRQRLRRETFLSNHKLAQFLPYGRANVGQIDTLNGTVIYLRTDEGEYRHVEGLSNYYLVFDETQYHDFQFVSHATYSLTQTHGKFETLGIGGEAGSEWHDRWEQSDQRHWQYDNDGFYTDKSTGRKWDGQQWRAGLVFDNDGLICNSDNDLKGILAGSWVPQRPENTEVRGYWMPQEIFARIPLTIYDAIHKYKVPATISIEWQEKNNPKSIYLSHCRGQFFKAERRPITPAMVKACMEHYGYLSLLTGEQVRSLKRIHGNSLRVLGGVDFGSSIVSPTTYLAIHIHWRKSGRYQLAWIEPIAQTDHPFDKAKLIAGRLLEYGVDLTVGDIGHGQDMIPIIQSGGRDSHDIPFTGVGKSKFWSSRTIGDETKPQMRIQTEIDERGEQLARVQIDKTTTIQQFIDFIGWKIPVANIREPWLDRPEMSDHVIPKFMIPSAEPWTVDYLVKDFSATTRKDLEKIQDEAVEDPRQKAVKSFNHPTDSMMANIYCLVADNSYDEGAYRISVGKRRGL